MNLGKCFRPAGQTLEDFSDACRTFASTFKALLPTGNNKVRIRVSAKDRVKKTKENTLGSTLGDESTGLVIVDAEGGHPLLYNQLNVFESIVAKNRSMRFQVDAVHDGTAWKRQRSSVEIEEDTFDDSFREKLSEGARVLREDTYVKANDPHLDAKDARTRHARLFRTCVPFVQFVKSMQRHRKCIRVSGRLPP